MSRLLWFIPPRMLAELKGVSESELAAATTENFFRLFTKVTRRKARNDSEARISGLRLIRRRAAPGRADGEAGYWGACDPANPKNRRSRCSLLLRRKTSAGETRVLVDTSPDMRQQLLDARVGRLDGVLITHAHADQLHGMDDLRVLVLTTSAPGSMSGPTASPWRT